MTNDSNTIRKEQSFEIALTEYRGKVHGYSRNEFIVNDTLYYIVKRVKGTIDGDTCEVKDDETLSYNFRGKPDKGVKVISTFRMNKQDSTWYLEGDWKTTKTKNYYSLTGKLGLKEEKNYSRSKLFPHLEELNLANDVSFYKEQKKASEPVLQTQAAKTNEPVAAKNKTKKADKKPGPQTIINALTAVSTNPESKKKKTDIDVFQSPEEHPK